MYILLGAGAEFDSKNNDGRTALHFAAMSKSGVAADLVKFLLSFDMDVDAEDNHKQTALHCAASALSKTVIGSLLKNGASEDLRDCEGNTPLDCANDRILEIFDQELSAKIMEILGSHEVSWLTLDILPVFTLSQLGNVVLQIGLDASAVSLEKISAVQASVGRLLEGGGLKNMAKLSMSQVKLSLQSSASTVGTISSVATGCISPTGTIGGILGRELDGPYIGLTCCHVISHALPSIVRTHQSQQIAVSLTNGNYQSNEAQCFDRRVHFPWEKTPEIVDWALVEFQHPGGFQGIVCAQS
jgi:hypothetical protein